MEEEKEKPLFRFTKENAAEFGRRGGMASTPASRISKRLNATKKCTGNCPLFPCFLAIPSGKCYLRKVDPKARSELVDIINAVARGDASAVKKSIFYHLSRLGAIASSSDSAGQHAQMLKTLCNVYRSVFGTKRFVQVKEESRKHQILEMRTIMVEFRKELDAREEVGRNPKRDSEESIHA